MRVGLEDNIRIPNGEMAKGSYEQVEWAVSHRGTQGREPATPDRHARSWGSETVNRVRAGTRRVPARFAFHIHMDTIMENAPAV